jgi:hypothetical protein
VLRATSTRAPPAAAAAPRPRSRGVAQRAGQQSPPTPG